MKIWFVLLLLACNCSLTLSQDIIVLRKNEQEVKCRIILLNDSLVIYRLWLSKDTTAYSVKKFEVLSFMMDKRSRKSKYFASKKEHKNYDIDLLGEYEFGTKVPGYVITNTDDTLKGFVTVKDVAHNQLQILFSNDSGKETTYSVQDAKGYGYRQIQYEKIRTGYKKNIINNRSCENGYHFLHLSVDGPSKLYRFYTLKFKSSSMSSFNQDPPFYLGKLKRQFVITNPGGKQIFTKGRTLKGAVNSVYYNYPKYISEFPIDKIKPSELPERVENFNYWFYNNN